MKKTLLLIALVLGVFSSCKTQKDPELKEAQKIIKEAKKIAKEADQQILFQKSVQAVSDQEFVIEADRINFKGGQSVYVNANTNFISLHEDRAVIQLAFNTPHAGPNGIGGITVEGTASNIKKSTDKKGNILFSMNVIGVAVSATVHFTLVKDSNQVTATVTPNFNSNRITFSGALLPESESQVFKGRSL